MSGIVNEPFVRMVRRLAKRASDRIIENASIDHALVIIECLLEEAGKRAQEVRIVSGCLQESFYSKLVDKISGTMAAGSTVDVVVLEAERKDLESNPFYQAVHGRDRGHVYVVHEDEGSTPHFVVTGDSRYRVEVDDEKKKAMACFNDTFNGRMLVDIHKSLVSKAEPEPEPVSA